MRTLLVVVVWSLVGCKTGDGKLSGRLTDVSWEGIFFNSCEVGIQYGEQSSRVEFLSSRKKEFCEQLNTLIGKNVDFSYHREAFSFTTDQLEQIESWTVIEK